jgi:hypothetical protein
VLGRPLERVDDGRLKVGETMEELKRDGRSARDEVESQGGGAFQAFGRTVEACVAAEQAVSNGSSLSN